MIAPMIGAASISIGTWASFATAVGTLALAGTTYLMVLRTADAAKSAKAEADATLDLTKLTRQEMAQAHLPVVVPVIEQLSITEADGVTSITVPIINIGVGPALGVNLNLHWLDQVGNPSVAGQPMRLPAKLGGLAPGGGWDMLARFRGLAVNPPLPFRVELDYGDTFGDRYSVRGRYFPEIAAFQELVLEFRDGQGIVIETIEI